MGRVLIHVAQISAVKLPRESLGETKGSDVSLVPEGFSSKVSWVTPWEMAAGVVIQLQIKPQFLFWELLDPQALPREGLPFSTSDHAGL